MKTGALPMRGILICLLPMLWPMLAMAQQQDIPFDKEHFTDRAGLQGALADLKEGNAHFEFGAHQFQLAIAPFERAYAFNPDNAELNMKLGLCYLNGRYRHESLPYFRKAAQLDPNFPRVYFLLGYAYQLSAQWDAAIAAFGRHLEMNRYTPDQEPFFNTAERHIEECTRGKKASLSNDGTQLQNLGSMVNSEYADYGLLIAPDGNTVYFTSRRENATGGRLNKATNEYFEDIYVTHRQGDGWTVPEPVKGALNTPGNDATVALYNEGRSMLIYRDSDGNGDLWASTLDVDGSWSVPKPLGPNVNSKSAESSAWVTPDGKWLFFVSDRPEEGIGGQDIYRSGWDETTADWGPAQNLGPDVNTSDDEEGVYLVAGGTLYFSSKGHSNIGGFDVFRTRETNGRWSRPENLGWPVNSPDDDLFYMEGPEGIAYVSSVRSGGWGDDDLFRIIPPPAPKPSADLVANAGATGGMPDGAMFTISGRIVDLKMLSGLDATIDLVDLDDPQFTFRFHADKTTGAFSGAVPKGRKYAVHIKADGHLLRSETITADDSAGLPAIEFQLKPIEEGIKETLDHLYFDKDKAVLQPASLGELGQLLILLRDNPTVRLEIGGHTDADGSTEHNRQLSEARAQAVIDHLVSNGIDAERLVAKGYGASQPVAPNDTEGNKALNRRTEMKVIGR